ncbi:aldo/keto reductase [Nonomuraea sp. NPDC049655]|uniref:aldo/keto reductase n=1 Tax=Nonomuraea sp. NPDC049655 TaxID=3364355 RepID=UPI003791877D
MRDTPVQTVTLNNGVEMPILGFGVFQSPAEQTEQAVTDALAASGIPREELFVTTTLWVQDNPAETHTRRAFETSAKKLGLDYLDLYLMHQPFGDVYGQWRAMQALHREGRIKAIGISNFSPDRVVDIVDHNDITPAVNQIELHPFFQRTADQQINSERGILIESWGPFAAGKNNLFTDPVLTEIGAAQGKSVAQVVLRWLIQRGVPVNAKSVNPERMKASLEVFDFELATQAMDRIAALGTG